MGRPFVSESLIHGTGGLTVRGRGSKTTRTTGPYSATEMSSRTGMIQPPQPVGPAFAMRVASGIGPGFYSVIVKSVVDSQPISVKMPEAVRFISGAQPPSWLICAQV